MEFLAANWFYILVFGAMMYMMFKGGGCCGGGHANHDRQSDPYGWHQGGSCCGGGHTDYEHMDHGNMSHMGHEEYGAGYIENSVNMDMAQDPVCGMYVSKKDAIVRQVNGRTYYFCSQNCANEFERKLIQ